VRAVCTTIEASPAVRSTIPIRIPFRMSSASSYRHCHASRHSATQDPCSSTQTPHPVPTPARHPTQSTRSLHFTHQHAHHHDMSKCDAHQQPEEQHYTIALPGAHTTKMRKDPCQKPSSHSTSHQPAKASRTHNKTEQSNAKQRKRQKADRRRRNAPQPKPKPDYANAMLETWEEQQ
jgi:hypothetical protein